MEAAAELAAAQALVSELEQQLREARGNPEAAAALRQRAVAAERWAEAAQVRVIADAKRVGDVSEAALLRCV